MIEEEKNRLSSLSYWFPIVSKLDILVPKTAIVPCNRNMIGQAYDGSILDVGFIRALEKEADFLGYPVFMRTDLSAGKHNWKNTCFVKNKDSIVSNVLMLEEYNRLGRFFYTSLVLREFLELETGFTAFPGDMPINKERRYFIRNGSVICHHPYWPEEAFSDNVSQLSDLNYETDEEVLFLAAEAQKVASVLPEYWSVDFAKTKQGSWYLIDMAVGEHSYHWKSCENTKFNA